MSNRWISTEVAQRLSILAGHLRIARKRRGWTIAETAKKAGINRNTMGALEQGKPGVAIGACVTVLWVLGLDRSLDSVAAPDDDVQGRALDTARLPQRVRKQRLR